MLAENLSLYLLTYAQVPPVDFVVFFSLECCFQQRQWEQVGCSYFSEKSVLHVRKYLAVLGSRIQRPCHLSADWVVAVLWLGSQQVGFLLSLGVSWDKCLARWILTEAHLSWHALDTIYLLCILLAFSLLSTDLFASTWDRAVGEVRVHLWVLLCSWQFWYRLV